ncbi:MAG: aminoacyl-histidine dipeptidase, partial [Bacteroidetes bacterium]|nr:aminoacyl-histidine dipeptidase [Bacteroidota bacterium]
LALLDATDIPHGPIECLFTVDEETGLTGAFGLKPGFLEGRILINLDSEDEGRIFIGCAGGRDTVAYLPYSSEPTPRSMLGYKVTIKGLKGGHSGDDINKGLGNATKILNRLLWNASRDFQVRISMIDAGNLRNAIAREATATIAINLQNEKAFTEYIAQFDQDIKNELRVTEPDVKIAAEKVSAPATLIDGATQEKLLHAVYACPHGVIEMSREIPNFVETSTNLASVKTGDKEIVITTSQRSSVESAKKDVVDMVESVFQLIGARVEHSAGYPGWKPNPDSPLLKQTVDTYRQLFQAEPKVLAVHAGLECGLIGATYPGMDMISIGPTMRGVHSPDEKIEITSVEKCWDLIVALLDKIGS